MTQHRWLLAVGLICVCEFAGCTRFSPRGLFARRDRAASTEDEFARRVIGDANRLAQKGDVDAARRLLDQIGTASDVSAESTAGSQRTNPLQVSRHELDEPITGEDAVSSGGGQFDVSSRSAFDERFAYAEAPPPKRRTSPIAEPTSAPVPDPSAVVPREFAPQPALVPGRLNSPHDYARESTAVVPVPQAVTMADYARHAAAFEPEVLPAGGMRPLPSMPADSANPWNRYQTLNDGQPATNFDHRYQPAPTHPQAYPGSNSAPPVWPGAPQPAANAPVSPATTPELWPRAPRLVMPNSSGNPASVSPPFGQRADLTPAAAPSNVQLLNGELIAQGRGPNPLQIQSAMAPRDGLAPPLAAATPINPVPSFQVAAGPATSSPEWERLIVQTAVEATSMKPGESLEERQAFLRKHVQLRLLQVLAGQTDRALQPIPGIDSADQEFWQQMLWGLANYFDSQGMPDAAERATQTIVQLQSAALRLQQKARLELRHLTFCNKITGFGTYLRFARDQFTPAQPVLLYADIGNFTSEPTADGQFRTQMKSTIDILEGGAEGRIVESIPFAPSEDRCRNHRRDYFHSYEFAVPQGIRPGPHVLQLTVEDQLGRKTSSARVSFTVE